MAAPVGHIFCALALLNSGSWQIADHNAFLVGTSFPDIRYLGDITRSSTHQVSQVSLSEETSFELGRRFHVYVDKKREAYMQKKQAYALLEESIFKTHMLKMVEDQVLFPKLGNLDTAQIFSKIYEEELSYGLNPERIKLWHKILTNYLDHSYSFDFFRYCSSLWLYENALNTSGNIFARIGKRIKILSVLAYAYFQAQKISKNKDLNKIILDFYEQESCQIEDF